MRMTFRKPMMSATQWRRSSMWKALSRRRLSVASACAALVATGCAGAAAAPSGRTSARPAATIATPSLAAGAATTESSATQPSASARMVCGDEIRGDVMTALGLPTLPAVTATWSHHLFSCVYDLPQGRLILAVKELPDVATAQRYFVSSAQTLGASQPLPGLATFGLPADASTRGIVLFRKDAATLEVDATGLPQAIGVSRESRTEFAFEIASDVLGCWTGA